MSKIRVNAITSIGGTAPVVFESGVTGDGSGLSMKPVVVSFNPAATATGISTTSDITVIFDQDMEFSGVGTIFIHEGSVAGTIATSFTCGVSTRATISGSTLVIDPADPLDFSQLYVVSLPSVGIANTLGAYYGGTNGYSFTTTIQTFTAQGGDHEFTIASGSSPTGYFKYHVFTSTGILTTTDSSTQADSLSAMIIAGGGGGGDGSYIPAPPVSAGAGGGGAGGLLSYTGPTLNLDAGTYNIVIGAGGIGTTGNDSSINTDPTNSLITVYGGGGGGSYRPSVTPSAPAPSLVHQTFNGLPGGSGGGGYGGGGPSYPTGASPTNPNGGPGVPGQGYRGGISQSGTTGAPQYLPAHMGGGGGGAGGVGGNADVNTPTSPPSNPLKGGSGGNGSPNPAFASTLIGPYVTSIPVDAWNKIGPTGLYGGGGGGASAKFPTTSRQGGAGGPGGGGQGVTVDGSSPWNTGDTTHPSLIGESGANGTGGGGGGGMHNSTLPSGGSGVFMIRYAVD